MNRHRSVQRSLRFTFDDVVGATMISASDVSQKIALLAGRELSLNAFENWLESAVWDVEQDSSEEAWDLVYSMRILFAERDNGRLDAHKLRAMLLALLNDAVIVINFDENLNPSSDVLPPRFSRARLFASSEPDPDPVFHLAPA